MSTSQPDPVVTRAADRRSAASRGAASGRPCPCSTARVLECDARACANNHWGTCLQLDVRLTGEGLCDSFRSGSKRQERPRQLPVVSACGLFDCTFNRGGRCTREHIRIGADRGVCCLMYGPE